MTRDAGLAKPRTGSMRLATCNRFAAAIVGGYVFAYGFVAFATIAGFGLGLRFFEAADLARMLGFIVYLCVMVWGFASRSVVNVWAWLAGGGVAMALAGWALSQMMLA